MLMLMLVMVMGDNDSSVPGRHDQSISGRSALAVQEVRGGEGGDAVRDEESLSRDAL